MKAAGRIGEGPATEEMKDYDRKRYATWQLERLDLTSRTEFSVQTKVLERARTKVEQLEARVSALELRIRELETGKPTTAV